MNLSLSQPIEPLTVTDQVEWRLKNLILSGELEPGQRLPSERLLAVQLNVSRLSLRAAIARLKAQNLVQVLHGGGTEVLDFRERGGIALMLDMLVASDGVERSVKLIEDLLEVRRAIAYEAVPQAVARHTPSQLQALRDLIHIQRHPDRTTAQAAEADLEIIRTILRMSGNLGMELLFNTIDQFCRRHMHIMQALFGATGERDAVYDLLLDVFERKETDQVKTWLRAGLEQLDRATVDLFRTALTAELETDNQREIR